MESPQSPHSSSLWVFALSTVESYRPLPPVPISHLGTKLLSTVLLLFGLRVISDLVEASLSDVFDVVSMFIHIAHLTTHILY